MKKVALVIKNAYSYTGTENICHFMSHCFSEISDVTLFSLEGEGETFYSYLGVKQIISYHGKSGALCKIVTRLKQEQFDAVFLISMGRLSVLFALYHLLALQPRMSKYYACEHIAMAAFSKPIKLLKFIFLRFYHRVIVLTERDRSLLAGWGIRTKQIPNPVQNKNYLRNLRCYHALAVGRLTYQKGFDQLLEIWSDFIKTHPHWRLTIAGEGELHQQLEQHTARLQITDSVCFAGCVSNIDHFYRQSDMLLMISRYEGLPMVLLEAKSWALPAIAYDCPTGPREIIDHQRDGFLITQNGKDAYIAAMTALADNEEKCCNQLPHQ